MSNLQRAGAQIEVEVSYKQWETEGKHDYLKDVGESEISNSEPCHNLRKLLLREYDILAQ